MPLQSSLSLFLYDLQWNPDEMSFASPQSNTLILPPISRTLRIFEPIFVFLGGSKNQDSTLLLPLWCFASLRNYYFQVSSNLKVILYAAKITQNTVTGLFFCGLGKRHLIHFGAYRGNTGIVRLLKTYTHFFIRILSALKEVWLANL